MGLSDYLADKLKDAPLPKEWKARPETLLHGQIPKPMHGLAPRVVLGSKWWNLTREAAYESTDKHCVACGVHQYYATWHQWLEGHEFYDIDFLLGRMVYRETVPLCHFCHNYIHSGRLEYLLEEKKVSQAKFDAIIKHGNAVLDAADLGRPEPYEGPMAEWEDWRLVVEGKEYPPLYKSFEEWSAKSNLKPKKRKKQG